MLPHLAGLLPGFFHSTTKEVNISMADEKNTIGHEAQTPAAGPSAAKAPAAPQAEQTPVQLGIENPAPPAADKKT